MTSQEKFYYHRKWRRSDSSKHFRAISLMIGFLQFLCQLDIMDVDDYHKLDTGFDWEEYERKILSSSRYKKRIEELGVTNVTVTS